MGLVLSSEDQRAAANISVTLSGQLIAAALAMLAIEGAVLSFVYASRTTSYWFLALIILAALSFIGSIFVAGKGITALRNKGYEGTWELNCSKAHFNWQAIFCIIGLVCFFGSAFFIGQPKRDKLEDDIILIKQELQTLRNEMERIDKTNPNKALKKDAAKKRRAP